MKKVFVSIITIFSLLSIGVLFAPRTHAAPATFTVTNTNDSGVGSFRQAIIDANTNGNDADTDSIEFNIAGAGPHVITSSSTIDVTKPVIIDGYVAQTGAAPNTAASPQPLNGSIVIELKGNSGIEYGIRFATGSTGSVIRGLSIHSFDQVSIRVAENNITVAGNYLAVKSDGLTVGDELSGAGLDSVSGTNGLLVGGTSAAARNIINGHSEGSSALQIGGSAEVYGNYIGIGKNGVTDLDSQLTLGFSGAGAIVGGNTTAERNVISGCDVACVVFTASENTIQGNYIGADYTGNSNSSISNGAGIIMTAGASENLIGGINSGEGNVLKGLAGAGISALQLTVENLGPMELISTKNAIVGNTIGAVGIFNYPNFGDSNLGIDHFIQIDSSDPPDFQPEAFSGQGPTANDATDSDAGPNDFINTPVLKTAQQIGTQLTVTYDLDAAGSPSNSYRVEFYASDTSSIFGSGPGEIYLGAVASTSPDTDKSATLTVSGDYANKALSATVTAIDASVTNTSGLGSTSEFSQNISIGSETDFDSDGAPDIVENQAPNNGDGNSDGTADRLQPTVTSYEIDSTGIFATLVTSGCSENGTVASVDVSTLAKADAGKTYPYGLVDFTLNCSRGDTVDVTKYVFVEDQPSSYTLRKFNPATEEYVDISGSTINSQAVGAATALVSTYSITDGGEYDDDGETNGIIVDPVGLATTVSLADTGMGVWVYILTVVGFLTFGAYLGHRMVSLRTRR